MRAEPEVGAVVERRDERSFELVEAGVEEGEGGAWRVGAAAAAVERFGEGGEEQDRERRASSRLELDPQREEEEGSPKLRWKRRWHWSGEGERVLVGGGR